MIELFSFVTDVCVILQLSDLITFIFLIYDKNQNSQTVPDVRHCSIDGNLVTDERAEAVIAVRRQRLLLLLRRQRHGGAIFSGTFKTKSNLKLWI